jgi:hypothetical protein
MQTIYEVVSSHKYRIVSTQKHYIVLSLEECSNCRIYVPVYLVPAKVIFELTSGINPSPCIPETCNEPGERYGRAKIKA